MNHLNVVRVMAYIGCGVSALALIGFLTALVLFDWTYVPLFLVTAAAAGIPSVTIILLTDHPRRPARPVDGLAVVILFWIIVPLFAAIPFFGHTSKPGLLMAYYEALSNLSTTGHTLLPTDQGLATPLLIWRTLLHLLGATTSLVCAVSVFAALNLGGPGIHRSRYFTIPEGSFFDDLMRIVRMAAVFVTSASLIIAVGLVIAGASPREAIAHGVSVITTGMVDPASGMTRAADNPAQAILMFFGLLVGTVGLVALDEVRRKRPMSALTDPEVVSLAAVMAIITALVFLAGVPLIDALGWSLSSVSTSGIALGDPFRYDRIPLVLFLLPVLIGGAALSTAGGIKLARMIVLSKRVGMEFVQLGYRGSVQAFTFRGRKQSEKTLMGVWVYLVAYIMACVTGILILSLFGFSFNDAIIGSVGSLSNAGHILDLTSDVSNPGIQIGLCLGMVLGRLEVVALIPALNLSFWRS